MSDNLTANKLEFTFEDKAYTLEYTPETIKQMEASGFNINDLGDRPATRIEQLWAGAFLANHKRTSNTIIKAMYKRMKDKDALLQKLAEMYNNALKYLLPDTDEDVEGNVEWRVIP